MKLLHRYDDYERIPRFRNYLEKYKHPFHVNRLLMETNQILTASLSTLSR